MSNGKIEIVSITKHEEDGVAPIVTSITGGPLGERAYMLDVHTDGGYAVPIVYSGGLLDDGRTGLHFSIKNHPDYQGRGSGGRTEIKVVLPAKLDVNGEKAIWTFEFHMNRYGIRVFAVEEVGAYAMHEYLYNAPDGVPDGVPDVRRQSPAKSNPRAVAEYDWATGKKR